MDLRALIFIFQVLTVVVLIIVAVGIRILIKALIDEGRKNRELIREAARHDRRTT